ncbi:MAG TPA: pro-sigmaK processing inhibitor BofA family protein [Methanocorpusculum sp.]|nr:pro-sigmaK processing inhibitor BofA family protein [Methanocorpusculum sp.]
MADLLTTIVMIIAAFIILGVLIFIFKHVGKILINSVCGLVILFIYRFLVPGTINFLPALGDLSLAQIIVCAVGGIPGAVIVIILAFLGITV